MNEVSDHRKCPVCERETNMAIRIDGYMKQPDEGDWCYWDGMFYIHEKLVWDTGGKE